jgi:hypothetical protein
MVLNILAFGFVLPLVFHFMHFRMLTLEVVELIEKAHLVHAYFWVIR